MGSGQSRSVLRRQTTRLGTAGMKRSFDMAVSGIVVAFLTPLFGAIAAAVLLDSGLPVFYSQERVGRGFRRFRIWKFRSMQHNSFGPGITVRGDSRITRVGKFLRATKLDELPQFWNVFVGDMSLVGPRPEVLEYVEMYRERYRSILTVRPGITDLASVKFRDEENVLAAASDLTKYYAQHVLPTKLDLAEEYLRKRSLLFDISILLRTLGVLLRIS
jgi:lipopolysaccharide/colanic/teichoic acid biosynthesis glycosyltransferase